VKLHIYRRDTLERTLDLTGHDLRIGRGAENDVVLEDADKTVSRFHAELRFENDEWILIDLNSQNGSWIDGERIQRASLGPGMTIALGHFRLVLEDPNAPLPPYVPPAPAEEELAPTIMMSAGAVQAASAAHAGAPGAGAQGHAPAHGQAQAPAASAAAASGAGAASGAAPKAAAQKRPKLTDPDPTRRAGSAMIPRPIFYGACLAILTLIIGVMYIMRPQPAEDYAPQADQTQTGPESNAQIIARELQDGKTKLESGDTTGAIEAFTRALLVDPNHPEALDLKMKAEEKRHKDSLAASKSSGQATPSATTASTDTPAPSAAATTVTAPATSATPPATATASTAGSPLTQAAAASAQKPGATGPSARELAAAKRKERAATAIAAKAYTQGKSALSAGRYREAIGAFESALLNSPNYQDATALLEQARAGVRGEAQKVVSQAQSLAGSGDLAGALREYERARQIDPNLNSIATGVAEVRGKMKGMGDEAYKRGRQLEAVGRLQDATMQYTRAAEMLPADDANGRAARERLENLKRQP
jgi:pSer/pThr/pTyr-binding forkhead associated (FHA) protein/tetratricopeptide (TPR) repeat protein